MPTFLAFLLRLFAPKEPAMSDEFARALAEVLKSEGGFVNNPKDPGGATNKGVTQRVYDAYRKLKGTPTQRVLAISDKEVSDIYRNHYWDMVCGDQLPPGVSYVVFDGAVNSGVSRSVRWLQSALGVTADGVVGAITLAAVHRNQDHAKLINSILNKRLAFLKIAKNPKTKEPLWPTFGKGWSNRIARVRAKALEWTTG